MLATPITVKGVEVSVGLSIGIALYSRYGHDPDSLIKAADAARHEVREAGKDGFGVAGGERIIVNEAD